MSLIVACATSDGPRIVSDTRVTFFDGRRPQYKTGTLKAVVLTADLVVCFAGSVGAGLDAVRECARRQKKGDSFEHMIAALEVLSADQSSDVEFLVASNGVHDQLTRIRGGNRETGLPTTWIGDQQAFERFQAESNKPPTQLQQAAAEMLPESTVVMMRLQNAMRSVLDDPSIQSVDDFCVSIAHTRDGFRYLESAFIHVGRDFTIRTGEELTAQMIQGVDMGGYQACVVEPTDAGTPALGVHFANARLGLLYLPLDFDEAQVFKEISPADFSRAVRERHGVELRTPLVR